MREGGLAYLRSRGEGMQLAVATTTSTSLAVIYPHDLTMYLSLEDSDNLYNNNLSNCLDYQDSDNNYDDSYCLDNNNLSHVHFHFEEEEEAGYLEIDNPFFTEDLSLSPHLLLINNNSEGILPPIHLSPSSSSSGLKRSPPVIENLNMYAEEDPENESSDTNNYDLNNYDDYPSSPTIPPSPSPLPSPSSSTTSSPCSSSSPLDDGEESYYYSERRNKMKMEEVLPEDASPYLKFPSKRKHADSCIPSPLLLRYAKPPSLIRYSS